VARRTLILKNRYFDSVFLMQVARRLAAQPGMGEAWALLATPANRKVLAGLGYGEGDADFAAAGPSDLVLALEGEPEIMAAVAADVEAWLSRGSGSGAAMEREPRSVAEAVTEHPEANVAVISVPGAHAAREARAALAAGLNVFLFSSNVTVEDELDLKTRARAAGLIVMGPDCGTAYLCGAGLGFANTVRRGPIGVVAATGTGLQEFACHVHRGGSGLSHALGTGGRDLGDAIGGLTALAGLDALEADPATKVVVVLSKPPGRAGSALLKERLGRCAKPVVLCLLGAEGGGAPNIATLDQAAALALQAVGIKEPLFLQSDPALLRAEALGHVARLRPEQRHIRGLFAGGTFCYQAQAIFARAGLVVHANGPLAGMLDLPDPWTSVGDTFVDLGAECFVDGRPHPMIDGTQRRERLLREGEDPTVAVILLDFILGAIASRDPVGDLLGAIRTARDAAARRGGDLCVVASVCGTEDDAQDLQAQTRALEQAGVLVLPTAAQAAAFCREAMLILADGKGVA